MGKKRESWFDKRTKEHERSYERRNSQRRGLLAAIAAEIGQPDALVVSYFGESKYGILDGFDVTLLEDLLQASDISGPLVLVLDSPGGSATSAERMVRVCRTYGPGRFSVIVPRMAKSAATLVCLGAEKIYMGPTAELGPVDPQLRPDPKSRDSVCAVSYVNAYERLLASAEKAKGSAVAYRQQLQKFDAVYVEEIRREIELSRRLLLDLLTSEGGMWAGKSPSKAAQKRLRALTDIGVKGAHERAVFFEELKDMGLNVEQIDRKSELWTSLWQLYCETTSFVTSDYTCVIETEDCTITGPEIEDLVRSGDASGAEGTEPGED